jgi:pilus assembly protein Flp/PilA
MIDLATGRKRRRKRDLDPVATPTFQRIFVMFNTLQVYLVQLINRFRRDEEGAALVEYGLLVGLIAVICIAAVTLLGQEVSTAFSIIASDLAKI